jgi:hypothetical protein
MANVWFETEAVANRRGDDLGVLGVEFPRFSAGAALQVSVRRLGHDVELLAALGRVAVTDV